MGSASTHWRTGTCGRSPGPARRAKASTLAAEREQLVVAAVTATQAHEAVGQDAALQEGVELVLHKLRLVGAGCGLVLLEESRGVLPHQAVQRGLFGVVALVVDWVTIGRPDRRIGLPADGLHTTLPSL